MKSENVLIKLLSLFFSALISNVFSEIKVDTLFAYETSGYQKEYLIKTVFKDASELSSFLNSTGYKTGRIFKKTVSTPDFKKSLYFSFSGWPCTITNIDEKKDSIIIKYLEEYRTTGRRDGIEHSRPADISVVYYIPFTKKIPGFLDVTDYGKSRTNPSK